MWVLSALNMFLWLHRIVTILVVLCLFVASRTVQEAVVGGGEVLELDGSPGSFAKLPRWQPNTNGSLSFEFRTLSTDALLLYMDDGGLSDFVQLKLVEGLIRLHINLGSGSISLSSSGRSLTDGEWHFVEIVRNNEDTVLKVDDETISRSVRGSEFEFGHFLNNSALFLGGLPMDSSSSSHRTIANLSLPWMYFEPRFRGSIRNVLYAADDRGIHVRAQTHEAGHGLRINDHKSCDHHDPCQHGGVCVSTDRGASCDCKGLDYQGTFCQKEKVASEATFKGVEFLSFARNRTSLEPLIGVSQELSLYFKTRQAGGLLFYSADVTKDSLLRLGLKDGLVVLNVKLGPNVLEATVRPARVRFDDNQWHKVVVLLRLREFSITVDGVYTERDSTTGPISLLSTAALYIGGSDGHSTALANGQAQVNFIGCLRKVEFSVDAVTLDILELARSEASLFEAYGTIPAMCQEVEAADPVTFTTPDAHLVLPRWDAAKTATLSLKVRTNEPSGVLVYSTGAENGAEASPDFFAIELLEGHLFLLMNLGSGPVKVKATIKRVDDGHWHAITLRRTGKSSRVTVDESAVDFIAPGQSSQLDLEGPFFLGGVGAQGHVQNVGSKVRRIPPELWAGALGHGFVGCVRDLVLNGEAVDIASLARRQDSGGVRPSCHPSSSQCHVGSCLNGGHCSDGWNRFSCDCSMTSFTGPNCGKDAATLGFNSAQYMRISLKEEQLTQADDVHVRFRTTRPSGLLFTSQSDDKAMNYLIVSLDSGRAKITLNMGEGNKVVMVGRDLNDDLWHSIKVIRRGPSLEVKLDNVKHMAEITGQLITLHASSVTLGALNKETIKLSSASLYHSIKDIPGYVGSLQQVIFNGKNFLEMARHGQLFNYNLTATFGKKDQVLHNTVTFKSRYTFIGLPQLKAYSTLNIHFQMKTLLANGLILYNGGKGQDFVAVELVNGHLHYLFNLGDGPRRVKSNTKNTLNDNKWHSVTISRPSVHEHTLMVDELLASVSTSGSNIHLDLDGILFLGGTRRSMYDSLPKLVASKSGFEGCLASLELNGELVDPGGADALIPSTLVETGCSGSTSKCTSSTCAHRGICVQLWNTYACDCDMTTYSGPSCAEESTAYRFSRKGGLLTYHYPDDKRPDTKSDLLALGLVTSVQNAIVLRVDSATSNDYMELQVVDGSLFMLYNLGHEDHSIGDLGVKVDDGRYHVIRFTRSGPNATIQVDNHNVLSRVPTGKQLTIFNSHFRIQVGGKRNSLKESVIEKAFIGILSGLTFNGDKIFDEAAEGDVKVAREGDIELLVAMPTTAAPVDSSKSRHSSSGSQNKTLRKLKPHQIMQQASKGSVVFEGDELILSGDGSGCWDDDDCVAMIAVSRAGDDLITPVLLAAPPTLSTPTASSSNSQGHKPLPRCDDDDEDSDDCDLLEGSGSSSEPRFPLPAPPVSLSPTPVRPVFRWPPPPTSPPPRPVYYQPPRPITSTTELYDNSYVYTAKPIPPPEPPPTVQSYRPVPTRPTGRPAIVDVPKPYNPQSSRDGQNSRGASSPSNNVASTSVVASADQTAMIIGLIAVLIIIIVIVAPLVLFFRVRDANNVLTGGAPIVPVAGGGRSVPSRATSALLVHEHSNSSPYHHQTRLDGEHLNGCATPSKSSNKKGSKEWYV